MKPERTLVESWIYYFKYPWMTPQRRLAFGLFALAYWWVGAGDGPIESGIILIFGIVFVVVHSLYFLHKHW